MKKILITGGLGHIGSHLIRHEFKHDDLYVVDNLSTQRYCSLFNVGKKYTFIDEDFSKITDDILYQMDVVIHLAAITNAQDSFDNKNAIEEININKTKGLIDRIKYHNTRNDIDIKKIHFIFPSSTSVYGSAVEEVFEDNDDFINPQSPYAESKIEIERYIKMHLSDYTILRLGTIFGNSVGMRFHTAINKFCYQAAFEKKLTVWKENYTQVRPYLGINDAQTAFVMAINNREKMQGTFNVLTGNYSLNDIIDSIQSLKKVQIEWTDTPLLNQYSYNVNYDKIKKIGYTPCDNLEWEIGHTLKLLKHN